MLTIEECHPELLLEVGDRVAAAVSPFISRRPAAAKLPAFDDRQKDAELIEGSEPGPPIRSLNVMSGTLRLFGRSECQHRCAGGSRNCQSASVDIFRVENMTPSDHRMMSMITGTGSPQIHAIAVSLADHLRDHHGRRHKMAGTHPSAR